MMDSKTTTTTDATTSTSATLDELSKHLQQSIQTLWATSVTLEDGDFQPQSQLHLQNNM